MPVRDSLSVSVIVSVPPSAVSMPGFVLLNVTVGNVNAAPVGMAKFRLERSPACTMLALPESTSTETVKSSRGSTVASALTSTVTSALVTPCEIVT